MSRKLTGKLLLIAVDSWRIDLVALKKWNWNVDEEAYNQVRKKLLQEIIVTRQEIFKIIEATIDCKDIDTLIQRYAIIFKELGITVKD